MEKSNGMCAMRCDKRANSFDIAFTMSCKNHNYMNTIALFSENWTSRRLRLHNSLGIHHNGLTAIISAMLSMWYSNAFDNRRCKIRSSIRRMFIYSFKKCSIFSPWFVCVRKRRIYIFQMTHIRLQYVWVLVKLLLKTAIWERRLWRHSVRFSATHDMHFPRI